jgi:hypothetical protein
MRDVGDQWCMFGDASNQDAEGHKADNEVDFALEEEILSRGTIIMAIIKKRSRSTSELHMIRLSSILEARGVELGGIFGVSCVFVCTRTCISPNPLPQDQMRVALSIPYRTYRTDLTILMCVFRKTPSRVLAQYCLFVTPLYSSSYNTESPTQYQSSSSRGLRIFYAWLYSRSDSEYYFAELGSHHFTSGCFMRQTGSHPGRYNTINTSTSRSEGWSILTYKEDFPLS